MMSIAALTRDSGFVFRGRVLEVGASSVAAIPARAGLAVVEVEQGLRSAEVLGDVTGQRVTVELAPGSSVAVGEVAIFFTRDWVHGENIAVHELDHLAAGSEEQVAEAVASLPDVHLQGRIESAAFVVAASVTAVDTVPEPKPRRQGPRWAKAVLAVEGVAKGEAVGTLDVYFPTGDDKAWVRCPRLAPGLRAVFVLHAGDPLAEEWLEAEGLPETALTALDPADVQPEARRDHIAGLVAG